MCFEMSKLRFDQTVTLTCKDRLGLELHNMTVLAIMKDAIDTAHGHASSSVVWLLCRQRLQLLALAAHTFLKIYRGPHKNDLRHVTQNRDFWA